MNWRSVQFDWNRARAFLVTAEEGSLSAAARALKMTQPTLGRQVTALEQELGVALFERGTRGLELTPSGLDLLEHVRVMGEAATSLSLTASGRSDAIEGQVSITATDGMSSYHLPSVLKRLREIAPEIEIEIVVSNAIEDLRRRDADIAIRHVRPEQPDLITRFLGTSTAHMYASTAYLEKHGRPKDLSDLTHFSFIGYENPDRMIPFLNALGLEITRSNVKIFANSGIACWEMLKMDLGVSLMLSDLADITEGVEVVLPDIVSLEVPSWLTTHRELRTSRRIRLVFDFLASELSQTTGS
ncbi:MAG: LysR family transcriptional regulator [Gammaproteobacteria bacterium]|nr:LysR family transcriptional regulator [Gammaproteobacteria bacterium]